MNKERDSAIYKKGRKEGYERAQADYTLHIKEDIKSKILKIVSEKLDEIMDGVQND